jgi:putative intracellular protease/amidase
VDAQPLRRRKVAILLAPAGSEQVEFTEPRKAVREAGADVNVLGAQAGGPWTLVKADVVRGCTPTSWATLATDIRNAGGTWVDQEAVTDQGLVTSRKGHATFSFGLNDGRRGQPSKKPTPIAHAPSIVTDGDTTT